MSSAFIYSLFAIAIAVVFFQPLLIGLARAAMLVIRPRLTRAQREARAQRALAARG